MNILKEEKRLAVLTGLVNGCSERTIAQTTSVSRVTISKLALEYGGRATWLHNSMMHDLACSNIELDEMWSYVKKKQFRTTEWDLPEYGEAYTYVALDRFSRLAVSVHVGKRNEVNTQEFVADLRRRVSLMPVFSSDGWQAYPKAIGQSFGPDVNYGQIQKNFKGSRRHRDDPDHRYEPPRDPTVEKKVIFGAPELGRIGTSYVERNNATMRHRINRLRRLNYGFSKKLENHKAAIALGYVHYNFCHTLRTTRVTPAIAAGIVNSPWDVGDLYRALMEVTPCEPPAAKRVDLQTPETTHRELPGGRGFLRVVPSGSSKPAKEAPSKIDEPNKTSDESPEKE